MSWLLALGLAVAAPRPAAPRIAPRPPLTVTFEEIGVRKDRVLRGVEGIETVAFTWPAAWKVEGEGKARIRFAHAPGYVESRLTVLLNGREVGAVTLDATNEAGGALEVPLPASLLTDYNTLTLVAAQRTEACAGPFDTSLWTRIGADSAILLPGAPVPVDPRAAAIREPLFDPRGYGPLRVTPVLPETLSAGSLAALTELGLALGRVADWRRVEVAEPVARVAEARTAALLLGTLAELPDIEHLVDLELTGDQGLVAQVANPADPTLPVLVVTGRTAEGVLNAARALSRVDRASWLTGDVAVVDDVLDAPPPPAERVPRPLGARDAARLADLGIGDHTGQGLYAAPLTAPLLLEGDALPRPDGTWVRVRYGYGAGLDPALSTLEVRFNDVGLQSVPLDRPEGDPDAVVTVKVPARLVGPHDTLQVGFNLFPTSVERCAATTSGQLWGTVYADSEVHVARDHAAALPELALLRHRWFPFGAEGPGERVTVLLGERAERYDVAAALQVVADLAARSTAPDPQVAIVAGRDERDGARILLAREDLRHPARANLGASRGGPRRGGVATIEALQPSATPGTGVLVVSAPDGARLLGLARQLGDDDVLRRLGGSRVVVDPDGGVAVVERAATTRVIRGDALTRLWVRLQDHERAFLLPLVPVALAGGFALRAWARRRGGVTE